MRPDVEPRQTLVTCLYDLATREGTGRASIDTLKRQSGYVLGLHQPMVIFVDPDVSDWVRAARGDQELAPLTQVVERPLEELEHYAKLPRIRSFRTFANGDTVKDTPLYQILNWSKFDLLRHAIADNPFGTEHFAWIDIGIGKVAVPPVTFPAPSERVAILQMRAVAPAELDAKLGFLEYERGLLAAGIIRGSRNSLLELAAEFRAELDEILGAGIRPNEQMVLSVLGARRPELFDFYYGSYPSILRNWDHVRADLPTVFHNLAHCRQQGLWWQALRLCQRIEASDDIGALRLTGDERARLLDEHFIAAWYTEQYALCQTIRTDFLNGATGSGYFSSHRDRILANFSFLADH